MNAILVLVLSAPPQVPAPPQAPTISEERLAALEAQVASIEKRLDRVELALELTPERGGAQDRTPACRCGLTAAPELPVLYVADGFVCPPCDALKAWLDREGIAYEERPGTPPVPRFVANGVTVIGNDPGGVLAALGGNGFLPEPVEAMTVTTGQYMEAAEPRRRDGGPFRRLGRFLFRRRSRACVDCQ